VEVTGPNRDLHSGLYGGAVVNQYFGKMIASLHDENIYYHSWFYDNVEELSLEERAEMAKAFSLENIKKHST
jgi:hypothetical protein